MGRVASQRFAREGARIVVVDANADAGAAAAAELGDQACFVPADVSNAADCEAMVAAAVETFGGLHVLYNNAGVFPPTTVACSTRPRRRGSA